MNQKELEEKYKKIADTIDDCKKRNSINDLSVLSYKLLNALLNMEIILNKKCEIEE